MSLNTKSLLEAYCQRNTIQSHEEFLSRLLDKERTEAVRDCVSMLREASSDTWDSTGAMWAMELERKFLK